MGVEGRVARWYIFKPRIPILGKFWGGLRMENVGIVFGQLEFYTAIWFVALWYIFPRFGTLCQEKSGNPGRRIF
jgi:hypothetical protein